MPLDQISPTGGDRGRKRMRKGTKSCTECKRRKIKCNFRPNDSSSCVECLEKNAECISQEYAARQSPQDPGSTEMHERLKRVEELLGRMAESMPQFARADQPPVVETARHEQNRSAIGSLQNARSVGPDSPRTSERLAVRGDRVRDQEHFERSITDTRIIDNGMSNLQQRLASLLPTQGQFDQLQELSYGWWLLRRHFIPNLNDPQEPVFERFFNVSVVKTCHPVIIARLLLCVALCVQQLPATKRDLVALTNTDLQITMETCFTTVTKLVTSDEDLTGSLEGVECLVLQGIYQTNAGHLRRAWLAFRKAISVVDLIGFRSVSQNTFSLASEGGDGRFDFLWYQVIRGERYLSLVLGVPSATGSRKITVDGSLTSPAPELVYHKHLCNISGQIIARNGEDPSQWLRITHEIDAKLDDIAKTVPQSWWHVPERLDDSRSDEAAADFERIMCHIWHFEVLILLHLPFMLRATTDRRYEYSRVSCLEACRGLIKRWVFIRERQAETLFSNLVEFQAFTATVTLLLGLLGPRQVNGVQKNMSEDHRSDADLVERVASILEATKDSGSGVKLVNQSLSVIRRLQNMVNRSSITAPLRLEIPYYGTVSITWRSILVEGQRGLASHQENVSTARDAHPGSQQSQASKDDLANRGRSPGFLRTPPTDTPSVSRAQDNWRPDGSSASDAQGWMVDMNPSPQFAGLGTLDTVGTANGAGGDWDFLPDEMMFFDSMVDLDFNMDWSASAGGL